MVDESEIENYIHRRGWQPVAINPTDRLLTPPVHSTASLDHYYELIKSYSFRIFLRDLVKYHPRIHLKKLIRFTLEEKIQEYIEIMREFGMLTSENMEGPFRLTNDAIKSFGDTFEWIVAEILHREFRLSAAWGIRIRNAACLGDLDVLAILERHLLYVETKSAPPRNIELSNVIAFLERIESIRPDLAIFLEDTHLRMKDKLVPMFQDAFIKLGRKSGIQMTSFPIHRLTKGLYWIPPAIYISNSHPTLVNKIGRCIQHYLKSKGIGWRKVMIGS